MHSYEAPYIDVRGDGAFALFDGHMTYRALVAAVTFKTFASEFFAPKVKNKIGLDIGTHIGIDTKTVLVRRVGLRRAGGRTDRQNEVWAGKPVNMAAKLASLSDGSEILVSDRYFKKLEDKRATQSCGCPSGSKHALWSAMDVSGDDRFDFDTAWRLGSDWCRVHGSEFAEGLLRLG